MGYKRVPLRATSGTKTLAYGLVQLRVGMMPAQDDGARLRAKLVDPDTHGPVKQQYVNEAGSVVSPAKAYPCGESLVTLDKTVTDGLKQLSDGVIQLQANVQSVPDEWVEQTYLLWPQDDTHEAAYKLLSTYLMESGRVLVGTTIKSGTTKAFAVRWSELYGQMVAQTLTYHARVRWDEVELVRHAVEQMAEPPAEMQVMASQIFETLPDTFDWEGVKDEYGEALEKAVKAAAGDPEVATVSDITAILQQSMREKVSA